MGMIHCHFSLIREYHQSSHCIWWRMKCERDFQYDIYIFVHFHTTSEFQQNNKSSPYFQKKKANNFFPKSCFFCLKTPTMTSTKNSFLTTKLIQKRNVLRTKPWWPWISSNISSHHIQPPTHQRDQRVHEKNARSARSAPPRDTPTGRNLMTTRQHGGDFPWKESCFFQKSTV